MTDKDRIKELEAKLEHEQQERKRLEALHLASIHAIAGSPFARPAPIAVFDYSTRAPGYPILLDLQLEIDTGKGYDRDHTHTRIERTASRFLKAGWHRFYLYSED